jgi:hypothetical protein
MHEEKNGIALAVLIAGALAFSFFAPILYVRTNPCSCPPNASYCYCEGYESPLMVLTKHVGARETGAFYANSDGSYWIIFNGENYRVIH